MEDYRSEQARVLIANGTVDRLTPIQRPRVEARPSSHADAASLPLTRTASPLGLHPISLLRVVCPDPRGRKAAVGCIRAGQCSARATYFPLRLPYRNPDSHV